MLSNWHPVHGYRIQVSSGDFPQNPEIHLILPLQTWISIESSSIHFYPNCTGVKEEVVLNVWQPDPRGEENNTTKTPDLQHLLILVVYTYSHYGQFPATIVMLLSWKEIPGSSTLLKHGPWPMDHGLVISTYIFSFNRHDTQGRYQYPYCTDKLNFFMQVAEPRF